MEISIYSRVQALSEKKKIYGQVLSIRVISSGGHYGLIVSLRR